MSKTKKFVYYFLLFLEGIVTSFLILNSPSESQTQLLFGLTIYRFGILIVIGIFSLIMLTMSIRLFFNISMNPFPLWTRVSNQFRIYTPILILLLAFVFFGIFFPENIPLVDHKLFERFAPILTYISLIGLQTYLFFPAINSRKSHYMGIVSLIVCLTIFYVGMQYTVIKTHQGGDFIRTENYWRHSGIINNERSAPYRYRVLSDYLLEAFIQIHYIKSSENSPYISTLDWQNEPIYVYPYEIISRDFRLLQNILLFGLAYIYYTYRIKNRNLCLLGLALLGISILNIINDNLSIDIYSDIIIFFIAGILIEKNLDIWIIPLTFIAAFNRESAVFIPIIYIINNLKWSNNPRIIIKSIPRKKMVVFISSFFMFLLTYFGLRIFLGSAGYAGSVYGKVYPGILLFYLNVINPHVWFSFGKTIHVLLIPIFFFKYWSSNSKFQLIFFIIPWYFLTFLFGSPTETRLLIVPIAYACVPIFLELMQQFVIRFNSGKKGLDILKLANKA